MKMAQGERVRFFFFFCCMKVCWNCC